MECLLCGHPCFDRPFIHRFIDPFIDSFISASLFSNAFEKKRSSIFGTAQDHPKTTPRPTQDHPKTTPRPPIGKVLLFHQNVDVALALAMGTFIENPSTRMTVLWNKRCTNVDFSPKHWFDIGVGEGHFYRESFNENDNSMKQETKHVDFSFKMLIWRWRWRRALL